MRNKEELVGILKSYENCTRCALSQTAEHIVFGKGAKHPIISFIGIGPGKDEDRIGLPFVGKAGKCLDKILELYNIDKKDCGFTNLVACRPFIEVEGTRKDRDPSEIEMDSCWDRLKATIELTKPSLLVVLGVSPAKKVLGIEDHSPSRGLKMRELAGVIHTKSNFDNIFSGGIIVTYHPSYIVRQLPSDYTQETLKTLMEDKIDLANIGWLDIVRIYNAEKEIRRLLTKVKEEEGIKV